MVYNLLHGRGNGGLPFCWNMNAALLIHAWCAEGYRGEVGDFYRVYTVDPPEIKNAAGGSCPGAERLTRAKTKLLSPELRPCSGMTMRLSKP